MDHLSSILVRKTKENVTYEINDLKKLTKIF